MNYKIAFHLSTKWSASDENKKGNEKCKENCEVYVKLWIILFIFIHLIMYTQTLVNTTELCETDEENWLNGENHWNVIYYQSEFINFWSTKHY